MTGFFFATRTQRTTLHRPKALAPLAWACITLVAGSILVGGIFFLTRPISLSTPLGRNYDLAPFDMIDAVEYCEQQTQAQMGDRLALSYLDDHSSRWDEQEGLYKIFMVAYSGEASDYNESAIHCYIDPKAHTLTHFRTIDLKSTSMISRALKFFK